MPRDLDPLPGAEIFVNLPAGGDNLRFHRFDLGVDAKIVLVGMFLQVV